MTNLQNYVLKKTNKKKTMKKIFFFLARDRHNDPGYSRKQPLKSF